MLLCDTRHSAHLSGSLSKDTPLQPGQAYSVNMENAFAKSADAVLAELGVNPSTGLSEEQVLGQRAKYGKNGMSVAGAVY